jgi:hypothetical protein
MIYFLRGGSVALRDNRLTMHFEHLFGWVRCRGCSRPCQSLVVIIPIEIRDAAHCILGKIGRWECCCTLMQASTQIVYVAEWIFVYINSSSVVSLAEHLKLT